LFLRGKLFRVTDAFAEFGVEKRPWLDPVALQSRYHELAVVRHPDKCGGDPLPLARLNEARRILASPPARLAHLLALTCSQEMAAKKFEPDFELFSQVGTLAERAAHISEKCDSSPLAAAVVGAEAASLRKEISPALDRIDLRIHALEKKIRFMDASWPDVAPQDLTLLAEEFSFLMKWRQSLRAARTRLLGG
jgi:curved DNA-binding protein CbpA